MPNPNNMKSSKKTATFILRYCKLDSAYCNMDDEALLGNDPVRQQWKGSDRCYAMAQYTSANNGVEDVFFGGRCRGYITSDNSTEQKCSAEQH
jgi:hypothetical protein